MTWFIIDDGMYDNPRVDELSLAAVGLWAKTGSWLGRQSRDDGFDGLITPVRVRRLGGTARLARELVDAGLWQATEGGWLVDWIDGVCVKPRERTREERERLSAVRAEAGRAGGRASGAARRSKRDARTKQTRSNLLHHGEANGRQNEALHRYLHRWLPTPDPSRRRHRSPDRRRGRRPGRYPRRIRRHRHRRRPDRRRRRGRRRIRRPYPVRRRA